MKKVLVVLLVAVMAVTSAFAAVTGSVTAELAYDLDKGCFDYEAANDLEIEFEFEETLNADKSGSLKPYVVVAAEVDIDFDKNFANETVTDFELTKFQIVGDKWVLDFIPEFAATDFATDAIDGYYVVNEDLDDYKFNPLTYAWDATFGNSLAFTYDGIGTLTLSAEKHDDAAGTDSTYELVEMTEKEYKALTPVAGVTYEEVEDAVVGLKLETAAGATEPKVVPVNAYLKTTAPAAAAKGSSFAVAFESAAIALTDELTVNAAVGYSNAWDALKKENAYQFGGSVKATYGDLVTIASDMGFAGGAKVKFDADIAAKISYKPVTFDVYYATNAAVFNYDGDAMIDKGDKDVVSMKAVADIEAIDTVFTATASKIANKDDNRVSFKAVNTTLEGYEFTLQLKDLAHKNGIALFFGVDADVTEDLNLTASFETGLYKKAVQTFKAGAKYVGIDNLTLAANAQVKTKQGKAFVDSVKFDASAKYAAALFDVEFDVWYNKYYSGTEDTYKLVSTAAYADKPEFDKKGSINGLVLALDLSTDKIVDGATLDFNWQSGRLTEVKKGEKASFGTLSASCTVEF